MKEKNESFNEYIDRIMGDELMLTLSMDAILEDWNIADHELFFALSCLNKYRIKRHPDHNWHITLINKAKAEAIAERKKDLSHQ
jgi:hypothetical protein